MDLRLVNLINIGSKMSFISCINKSKKYNWPFFFQISEWEPAVQQLCEVNNIRASRNLHLTPTFHTRTEHKSYYTAPTPLLNQLEWDKLAKSYWHCTIRGSSSSSSLGSCPNDSTWFLENFCVPVTVAYSREQKSKSQRASPGAMDAFLTSVSISRQTVRALCTGATRSERKRKKYQDLVTGCHCFLRSPAPETLRNQSVPHSFVAIRTSKYCLLTMAVWCSNMYLCICINRYLLNIYCKRLALGQSEGKRHILNNKLKNNQKNVWLCYRIFIYFFILLIF